jgi:hypothetical protein
LVTISKCRRYHPSKQWHARRPSTQQQSVLAAQGIGEDKARNTSGIHLPERKRKSIVTSKIITIYLNAKFVTSGLVHAHRLKKGRIMVIIWKPCGLLSVVRFTHNTSEDDSASGDLEKTKP